MKSATMRSYRLYLRRVMMLSVALAVGVTGIVKAETWTIDNNPGNVADFRGLQEANDDPRVDDGDIIYIAGSPTIYPSATMNKSLTLYGPGYFLPENRPPVNSLATAMISELILSSTPEGEFGPPPPARSSAGTKVIGLQIGTVAGGVLYVEVDEVTVQRCHVPYYLAVGGVSNTTVLQSYIGATSGTVGSFWIQSVNNIMFANCFIGILRIGGDANGAVVQNNVINDELSVPSAASTVVNNILLFSNPNAFTAGGIFNHNMLASNGSFLPDIEGGNNINGPLNPAQVFVDAGTTDGRWQLKPEGPATGVGMHGIDLGMFGGATPYVLSGIPPIPTVVIDANPTGTGLNGLQIRIQGHAHN